MMPATWPDGTPRSSCNAFSAAYLPRAEAAPTVVPPKRGPKAQPKSMRLPGSSVLDSAGRRIELNSKRYSVAIGKTDPAATTKLLRAAI